MRATVGDLEDVAPGFAGWSDDVAVVTHVNIISCIPAQFKVEEHRRGKSKGQAVIHLA